MLYTSGLALTVQMKVIVPPSRTSACIPPFSTLLVATGRTKGRRGNCGRGGKWQQKQGILGNASGREEVVMGVKVVRKQRRGRENERKRKKEGERERESQTNK